MLNVRLSEKYQNNILTLMCGFAIVKGDIKPADENNKEIKLMLEQGFLEVVDGEAKIKPIEKPKGLTVDKINKPAEDVIVKEPEKKEVKDDGDSFKKFTDKEDKSEEL